MYRYWIVKCAIINIPHTATQETIYPSLFLVSLQQYLSTQSLRNILALHMITALEGGNFRAHMYGEHMVHGCFKIWLPGYHKLPGGLQHICYINSGLSSWEWHFHNNSYKEDKDTPSFTMCIQQAPFFLWVVSLGYGGDGIVATQL